MDKYNHLETLIDKISKIEKYSDIKLINSFFEKNI